ncbi:hypothetical protein [Microcoleus sp. herbarium14]|uniref:hypothetical protein n=1 Tax=Microcoleus sp. herbarium14 TaxID=3055439 RepID=UPI002FD3521A
MTQIELGVWEFNEGAIAFYEKLGYETAYRKNVEVTEVKVSIAHQINNFCKKTALHFGNYHFCSDITAQKIVLESSIHSRRLGTDREEQSSCSLGEVVGQPPFGYSQLKATLQQQPRICNRFSSVAERLRVSR